ncbi:MAG TPA: hybrid sensor histidine kinase/response regulator [Gammaproteobacteria bacterium]|nr:hybrid sensor histidine kinase/response regulator [Gammaproteobacteria bacterium]
MMQALETKPGTHPREIDADKIRLIHSNMPVMFIGNLVGCLPIAIILWNQGYTGSVIAWVTAVYTLTLARWLHHRQLKITTASNQQIFNQGKGYLLFSLLSGSIWGSIGVVFFNPDEITSFTFMIVTLASFVGGSMTSMSAKPLYYYSFVLPATTPIIFNMLLQNTPFYFWLGVAAIIYLSATVALSKNLHRVIHNSLILKYENIDLLADLKSQTDNANRDKSRFIAAASHDLRQPLHAVNLFVETLSNKIRIKDQQHDINRIRRGLSSMSELFDALLDISKLDSETSSVNQIDFPIDELLHNLTDQFSNEAETKQLSLTVKTCNEIVRSDPVLLERLIGNLLSNAIRYTEKGSVTIFFEQHNPHTITLYIRDTGIGIPSDKTEEVFDEFTQLHNPERDRNKGLGLGLAIVRRISKLLGITLQLDSEVGKGSQFTIELPLCEHHVAATSTQYFLTLDNKLNGLKILVIDNESDILDAMQNLLETWQCDFTGAASSEKALKLISEDYRPEFILADYRLPGELNGCKLISDIRQTTGQIPALIITGDTGVEIDKEAAAVNLITLRKPIKPAQLRVAMTQLLKKYVQV